MATQVIVQIIQTTKACRFSVSKSSVFLDISLASAATPLAALSGIETDEPEEIDASWANPRVILEYQIQAPVPISEGQQTAVLGFAFDPSIVESIKASTSFDTDEKIKALRSRALAFFASQYGFRYLEGVDETPLLGIIPVLDNAGEATDSFIALTQLLPNLQYHGTSLCVNNGRGTSGRCSEKGIYMVNDYSFAFIPGPSGYTIHGAFGGDSGILVSEASFIVAGLYSFEGIQLEGVNDGENMEMVFFGECPIQSTPIDEKVRSTSTVLLRVNNSERESRWVASPSKPAKMEPRKWSVTTTQ